MRGFEGFGVVGRSNYPLNYSLKMAIEADRQGFDLFSLAEGVNGRSAIITSAAIACKTLQIKIAIGIMTPYLRHLMSIAADAVGLDHLSKGRFLLGLGAPIWKMADYGHTLKTIKPLQTLREAYVILKDLTSERPASIESKFFGIPKGIRLELTPFRSELPIFFGVVNKLLLQLSGELCDQIQLGAVTHAEYVRWAVEQIKIGAKRAGRDPNTIPIMGHILTCIDNDPKVARNLVKPILGRYFAVIEKVMFKGIQITDKELTKIKTSYQKGGEKAAAKFITDDMVEQVAAVGTVDDCIGAYKRLLGTGLTIPLFWGPLGKDQIAAVSRIGQEVLPQLPRHTPY